MTNIERDGVSLHRRELTLKHPVHVLVLFTFTFTFSHLADAFIQSDLQLGNT